MARTTHRSASSALGHGALAIAAITMLVLCFAIDADATTTPMGRMNSPMLRLRGGASSPKMTRSASQQDMSNPNVSRPGPQTKDSRKEKIWQLTKAYKPVDKESIQRSPRQPSHAGSRPAHAQRACSSE